jgi:hypothetical protein
MYFVNSPEEIKRKKAKDFYKKRSPGRWTDRAFNINERGTLDVFTIEFFKDPVSICQTYSCPEFAFFHALKLKREITIITGVADYFQRGINIDIAVTENRASQ